MARGPTRSRGHPGVAAETGTSARGGRGHGAGPGLRLGLGLGLGGIGTGTAAGTGTGTGTGTNSGTPAGAGSRSSGGNGTGTVAGVMGRGLGPVSSARERDRHPNRCGITGWELGRARGNETETGTRSELPGRKLSPAREGLAPAHSYWDGNWDQFRVTWTETGTSTGGRGRSRRGKGAAGAEKPPRHPQGDPGVREQPPPPQREERGLCPRGDNGDIDGDLPGPPLPPQDPPWQKATTPPAGTPPPLAPAPSPAGPCRGSTPLERGSRRCGGTPAPPLPCRAGCTSRTARGCGSGSAAGSYWWISASTTTGTAASSKCGAASPCPATRSASCPPPPAPPAPPSSSSRLNTPGCERTAWGPRAPRSCTPGSVPCAGGHRPCPARPPRSPSRRCRNPGVRILPRPHCPRTPRVRGSGAHPCPLLAAPQSLHCPTARCPKPRRSPRRRGGRGDTPSPSPQRGVRGSPALLEQLRRSETPGPVSHRPLQPPLLIGCRAPPGSRAPPRLRHPMRRRDSGGRGWGGVAGRAKVWPGGQSESRCCRPASEGAGPGRGGGARWARAARGPAAVRKMAAGARGGSAALRRLRGGGAGAAPRGARGYSRDVEGSWFRSLFVHKVDPRKDAHSNLLSKKETSNLYKIQFHNVKPECLEAYNKLTEEVLPKLHSDPDYPCDLVGNWNTWYGEQDQAVHLWRFSGGYPALMDCMNKLRQNKEYLDFRKERSRMLLSRRNQLLLEFSFWNEPQPRQGPNIYELRTYKLKPGTMIEWGNNWARAIKYRQENQEAVGGFFSQIGELYVVHHLWAYRDLQSREETRNAAWRKRGWDENVYYTVPLIRTMESRIMIPLKISPLQ